MMPQEFIEEEKRVKKEAKTYCANAPTSIKQNKMDYQNRIFELEIVVAGCENKKRHASKYCQSCSDLQN